MFYGIGARVISLWNQKARQWVKGRRNIFDQLHLFRDKIGPNREVVWMHSASLGEFEQGRPVLEALKKIHSEKAFLVTFFSPSGYEIRKNYSEADGVFYLPLDGPLNAKEFICIVQPKLVLWIKYEYWFYYLKQLSKNNIPVILVSAIFRKSQPFFKKYGSEWRKILKSFNQIFVQNEDSLELLKEFDLAENATIGGDTRFDRVATIIENNEQLPEVIYEFIDKKPCLVAGSTWEEDELQLAHFIRKNSDKKFIIAPHEIDEDHIQEILKIFPNALRFSRLNSGNEKIENKNVLIIDNIGMLSKLYRIADVTLIGGGFNDSGIHNTLEAAAFGKPILFGPNYEKFAEAVGLIDCGGAFSFSTPLQLEEMLNKLFEQEDFRNSSGKKSEIFVQENKGATMQIVNYIEAKRLLTN